MKNIQIRFKFPTNSELKREMESAMKSMEKYSDFELKLDTKSFNNSLKEMSKMLQDLKNQVSKFGVLDNIVNENKITKGTNAIKQQSEAMREYQNIIKQTQTFDSSNKMIKVVTDVKDEYGKIIQYVDTYDSKTGELVPTLKKVTDEVEKQSKAEAKLSANRQIAQNRLTNLYNNGNSDIEKLIKLQSQLDNINTDNAESEFKILNASLKQVENNDKAIQKEIKKRQELESSYNDWWLKSLKQREIAQEKVQAKAESDIEKFKSSMQSKLDTSSSFKNFMNIDTTVLDGLQNKLNSINTNSSEKEINELKQAINNLSSSDKSIVRLQNAILKHNSTLDILKKKYKDLDLPEEELKEFEQNIKTLDDAMKRLNNGEEISANELSIMLNEAGVSARKFSNEAKIASDQQRVYNKEVVSFSGALKDVLTKVGLFSVAYTALNSFTREFKDGVKSVVEMDTAMANLNKVVDLSKSELNSMKNSAVEMGEALGRSSIEIANAQAEFGRMYKSVEEINRMTEASILGANIMDGINADEVAKGLTTIMSSMKIESSEVMSILDSMNEVQNNYRISATDMLEALGKVGSTANVAGVSLQELEGYITAIAVSTGKSGDEIGNSLKSLTARIYKIGSEGIEAQGKPEQMLESMGVAVRDLEGEFRPLNDILVDLDKSWGDMSQTEKIATAQVVAGTHKYNDFIALMDNFDTAIQSTATAMDSMGSATKENEIYLNSIEGKMSSLKATAEGFWYKFIDSDMIRNGVSSLQKMMNSLTDAQDKFGSLGMTLGTLTGAFLLLTKNPLKNFVTSLNKSGSIIEGLGTKFKSLNTTLKQSNSTMTASGKASTLLSIGFNKMGIASMLAKAKVVLLQTALSMGLAFAIMGAIGLIGKLVDSMKPLSSRMDEIREKSTQLNDSLKLEADTSGLLKSYVEIGNKLENINLSEEERNSLNEQLVGVKNQLIGIDGDYETVLGNQNLKLEEQASLIERMAKGKMRSDAKELEKSMGSNGSAQRELANLKSHINLYNKTVRDMEEFRVKGDLDGVETATKNLDALKNMISESSISVEQWNYDVETLEDVLGGTNKEMVDFDDTLRETVNTILDTSDGTEDIANGLENVADSAEDGADAIENVGSKLKDLNADGIIDVKDSMLEAKSAIDDTKTAVENLANAFSSFDTPISLLEDIIADLDTYGMLTDEVWNSTISSGQAEIIALLGDENTARERANELLSQYRTEKEETANATIIKAMEEVEMAEKEAEAVAKAEEEKRSNLMMTSEERHRLEQERITKEGQEKQAEITEHKTKEDQKVEDTRTSADERKTLEDGVVYANQQKYIADENNYSNSLDNKLSDTRIYVTNTNNALAGIKDKTVTVTTRSVSTGGVSTGATPRSVSPTPQSSTPTPQGRSVVSTETAKESSNVEIGTRALPGGVQHFNPSTVGSSSSVIEQVKKETEAKIKAEKDYQKERERLEKDATSAIEKLRNDLVDALKKKYEELRDKELSVYDKEIELRQKQLDKLRNGYVDEADKIAKIEEQLAQWKGNDSAYSKQMISELEKQLEEAKLEKEIKDLEKKKDEVNEKYDKLTDEEKLYNEANNLVTTKAYNVQMELLNNYSDAFKDISIAMGQSLSGVIKDELKYVLEALDYLRGHGSIFPQLNESKGRSISSFDTGGYTGDFVGGRLAVLHNKERILNAQQTLSFERLVDSNILNNTTPLSSRSGSEVEYEKIINGGNVTFNSVYNVETKTEFDARRFNKNVSKEMKKELLKSGKRLL